MYSRSISPSANISGSSAASPSTNHTFRSAASRAFSMATTMASGTFSTAISSTSGSAAAVPTVKPPLPQPSSTRSSRASGISSRQRPRRANGSRIRYAPQASIRGARFFFFRIRIFMSSPFYDFLPSYPILRRDTSTFFPDIPVCCAPARKSVQIPVPTFVETAKKVKSRWVGLDKFLTGNYNVICMRRRMPTCRPCAVSGRCAHGKEP